MQVVLITSILFSACSNTNLNYSNTKSMHSRVRIQTINPKTCKEIKQRQKDIENEEKNIFYSKSIQAYSNNGYANLALITWNLIFDNIWFDNNSTKKLKDEKIELNKQYIQQGCNL